MRKQLKGNYSEVSAADIVEALSQPKAQQEQKIAELKARVDKRKTLRGKL